MPTVTPRTDSVEIAPIMGRRHEGRKWLAYAAAALAAFTPLWFMVAALGSKVGLWSWATGLGFLTRTIGVNLLYLTLALGVVVLLLGIFLMPRRRRAIVAGAAAVAVGLAGLAWGASVRAKAQSLPFIHDITTDTQDPPVFAGRILAERAGVERVNTLDYVGKTDPGGRLVSVAQTQAYPDVRPLITDRSPDDAFRRAREVAQDLGWDIKDTDAEAGTIEATDTTFWYGFEDDVVIRIRPGAGGGSVVDMRSVSRVGGSDLGANAERVRDFLEVFGA